MIIHVIMRHKTDSSFRPIETFRFATNSFFIFVVQVVKDATCKANQMCRRKSNNQISPQLTERGSSNAFISLLLTFQYSVRSSLLFRKIVEIERFALLAAILDECQI